jgi:hypothetical protein
VDFRIFFDPFWGFTLKTVLRIHDPRISWLLFGTKNHEMRGPPVVNDSNVDQTWPAVHVRVIEQCCYNPDLFNGQTANCILKPPKVIESRTYAKKANPECYWNNTVILLWRHVQLVKFDVDLTVENWNFKIEKKTSKALLETNWKK